MTVACVTPTRLYREYLVSRVIKEKISNKFFFLEIGCGTGDFSLELANLGFSGEALDFSEEAIKIAKKKLKKTKIRVFKNDFFKHKGQFDAIFMFETLEHIKNYRKAINKVFSLLKPGGRFLFSVPAHRKMFGRDDQWAGHDRRHEKQDLTEVLKDSGFLIEIFWGYGFPVFNLTRRVYNLLCRVKRRGIVKRVDRVRPEKTGVVRYEEVDLIEKIRWLYPFLKPIFKFCDLFLSYDLGVGYICLCRKR